MAGLVGFGLVRLHGWFGWVRVSSGVMGVRMGWGSCSGTYWDGVDTGGVEEGREGDAAAW